MNATPTREQLQLAFRHYADHHWPATLEDAMARPAFRATLEQLARRLNRPAWGAGPRTAPRFPQGPVPPTPHVPRSTTTTRPLSVWTKPLPATGRVDIKRLAANDKDED